MPNQKLEARMWAEACAAVDRADRLHRQFFHHSGPHWQAPIDVFETDDGLTILIALPGVELVLSAAYSNGTAVPSSLGLGPGRFDGYTGSAQTRIKVARLLALVVSGHHYEYRLNAIAAERLGVSRRMSRNSIRIGVTWSLPLFGFYVDQPRPIAPKD